MLYLIRAVRRLLRIFPVFLTLLLFMQAGNVTAEDKAAKKVAVLPFEMHAPSSMSYLQEGLRDMLASRLAANAGAVIIEQGKVAPLLQEPGKILGQNEAVQLAKELAADYIVTGSLTALGGSMSLDAKVIAADETKTTLNFYASAPQENNVIDAINQLSWDIAAKVFGATPPAAVASAKVVQPAPAAEEDATAAFKTEHPDKAYKEQNPGQTTGMVSPLVIPQAIGSMQGFAKTQNLDLFLTGMDVGDIDGDGELDIVLAELSKISVYRLHNNRLIEFGSVEMPARSKIHAVGLGDMDGNGRDEIYISAADDYNPHSWAYEWDTSRLDMVLEDIPWYIRVLDIPGEGRVLTGQRGGQDSLLLAGIFRLMKNGAKVMPAERIVMPDYINLFDFALADVTGNGAREIIGISRADRLYVVRTDGSVLWISEDFYGGTSRYIGQDYDLVGRKGLDTDSASSYNVIGKEGSGKRIYIPSRIMVMDVNGDGRDDVIVNKNISNAYRHFENFKRFKTSEINALTWNGIGLSEIWQTKKIDGYIPDFRLMPLPEKADTAKLFVGLVLSRGWASPFTGGQSTVLVYDLELPGEKEAAGKPGN